MQKIKMIAVAAALMAVPAVSFAQSSPSPANTAGPGISPSVPAPTDMGIGSEDGIRYAVPGRQVETTGAAVESEFGAYAAEPGPVRVAPYGERRRSMRLMAPGYDE